MTTLQDQQSIQDSKNTIDQLQKTVSDNLKKSDSCIVTGDFRGQNDQISSKLTNEYIPELDKLTNFALSGDSKSEQAELTTLEQKGDELQSLFTGFTNALTVDGATMSQDNMTIAGLARINLFAIIAVGIAASVALAVAISKSIVRPLDKATEIADRLSVGDVDTDGTADDKEQTEFSRKDEIGELFRAFKKLTDATNKQAQASEKIAGGDLTVDVDIRSENDRLGQSLDDLVKGLRRIASSIRSSAEIVASGSTMVSDSSVALSHGATEQASAVEQLSASLNRLSEKTAENARNAEKASELVMNSKNHADRGNEQMTLMLGAMDDISKSSDSIGKIIKVIDDIAFQTNILALNAAVESARAGQYGKGFAVVADEVRSLASKSAGAVKETTELIENSARKVEIGKKVASETAEALRKIVSSVEEAAGFADAIAFSSGAQAAGIAQINEGIVQISQVVQTNAATSEESAAASEELSQQSSQLRETVSIFKLKDNSRQKTGRSAIERAELIAERQKLRR